MNVGGMQLFRMESSDQSEKAMPRAAQVAAAIGIIYLALTVIWAGALWFAGLSGFDAITHAMTTIATGGFSTHDDSIAHFESAKVEAIITLGMFIGSLPFLLYLSAVRGRPGSLFRDSQVQWFAFVLAGVIILVAGWLWIDKGLAPTLCVGLFFNIRFGYSFSIDSNIYLNEAVLGFISLLSIIPNSASIAGFA